MIWGMFAYYLVQATCPKRARSPTISARRLKRAGDPLMLVGAHVANGISLMYVGQCRGLSIIASRPQRCTTTREAAAVPRDVSDGSRRVPPQRATRARYGSSGVPTRRSKRAMRALELGADSPDPRSLAFANAVRRRASSCCGAKSTSASSMHHECIAICDEHGIAQERVWAMAIHGWALAHTGKPDEGIREIEASIAFSDSRHAELQPDVRASPARGSAEHERLVHRGAGCRARRTQDFGAPRRGRRRRSSFTESWARARATSRRQVRSKRRHIRVRARRFHPRRASVRPSISRASRDRNDSS